jgi:hypothetical protein
MSQRLPRMKKDADFDQNGEHHVEVCEEHFRVYFDKASSGWLLAYHDRMDAKERERLRATGSGPFWRSQFLGWNRDAAVEELQRRVQAKDADTLAYRDPAPFPGRKAIARGEKHAPSREPEPFEM